MKIAYDKLVYTGNKVYDPTTKTYSTGYWARIRFVDGIQYGLEQWIPIWEGDLEDKESNDWEAIMEVFEDEESEYVEIEENEEGISSYHGDRPWTFNAKYAESED